MEVSRQDLAETFRELSDEDLLERVKAGTLTEMALDVATSELRVRGLEAAEMPIHEDTDAAHLAEHESNAAEPADDELNATDLADHGTNAAAPEDHEAGEDELADEEGDDSEFDLVTVARFSNPLQASVLRACLESHGIHVYLWGEHLGTAHIFLSVAAGGMRIQVPRSQVPHAREVIAAWERGELAIDGVTD